VTEDIPIKSANGREQHQIWYYPSRKDCLTCHTAGAGGVLGVKTRQMNHDFKYPSGVTDNELRSWNRIGLFEPAITAADIANFPTLAASDDTSRSLEDRARSLPGCQLLSLYHPEARLLTVRRTLYHAVGTAGAYQWSGNCSSE